MRTAYPFAASCFKRVRSRVNREQNSPRVKTVSRSLFLQMLCSSTASPEASNAFFADSFVVYRASKARSSNS